MTGCLCGSSLRSIVCSLLTWAVWEQTMPKTSVFCGILLTALPPPVPAPEPWQQQPTHPHPHPHTWPLTKHHPSPVPPSHLEALTQRASGTVSSASPTFVSLTLS
ncbi:hypothetical protein BJV74DRAFT_800176 [Russula compacta]|nr:hypothetical protein BJV74DRAFT_800176 [Russula compacta]